MKQKSRPITRPIVSTNHNPQTHISTHFHPCSDYDSHSDPLIAVGRERRPKS